MKKFTLLQYYASDYTLLLNVVTTILREQHLLAARVSAAISLRNALSSQIYTRALAAAADIIILFSTARGTLV